MFRAFGAVDLRVTFLFAALISLVFNSARGQEASPPEKIPTDEKDADLNEILNWQAPYTLRKNFPYFLSGYDDEGCPLWVVEVGKWNFHHLLTKNEATFEDIQKYIRQTFSTMYVSGAWPSLDSERVNATEETSCETHEWDCIVDFEGFSNVQVTHPQSLQSFLNVARILFELEGRGARLKTGFGINLNYFANTLYGLVRPLLGNLSEKLKPLGTNAEKWKPELLRSFPKRALPDWMGGYQNFTAVKVFG